MINHFLLLKFDCQKNKIPAVLSKICTSLLRYTKEIRADKAFYDAGEANKNNGQYNMAFIFFNRYLDLFDAIDDPDGAGISDNQDFEGTDIPSPYEIPLPEKNFLSMQDRDMVRDWVLQMNMEDDAKKGLNRKPCE